jgi:hypothetical protein
MMRFELKRAQPNFPSRFQTWISLVKPEEIFISGGQKVVVYGMSDRHIAATWARFFFFFNESQRLLGQR